MSCGQQALSRLKIDVENYFASEIDKFAIQITKKNYPDTIHIGDVRYINYDELPNIDLLIGGSPCQSFSFAGKRKGMSTKCEIEILSLEKYIELKDQNFEFEGQSYLFWEFVYALKKLKPKYFLLENVQMVDKWKNVISKALGINPISINASLVSAQNRDRLFWTNIKAEPSGFFGDMVCTIPQPKDRGILLKHILQPEEEVAEKYYLSERAISGFMRQANKHKKNGSGFKFEPTEGSKKAFTLTLMAGSRMTDNFIKVSKSGEIKKNQDKASCFTAGANSGGNHSDMDLIVHNTMQISSTTGKGGSGPLSRADGKTYCLDTRQSNAIEYIFSYNQDKPISEESKKMSCLRHNPGWKLRGVGIELKNTKIRRLTPIECERLQCVEDNYTEGVSDSQRYKMLGNGWNVEVIKHIFSFIS